MRRQPLKTKRPSREQIVSSLTRIAPVRGWNTQEPRALMSQGFAQSLINWWPTPSDLTIRKGAVDHVTGFTAPVKTLMSWAPDETTGAKLFAATDAGIYDVTTAGTRGSTVSTLVSGSCSYVNFSVSGGNYLFVANGVNSLRHYDGTAWTSITDFTLTGGGGTYTSSAIAGINIFKRRLFFTEANSLDFYYLPIDSIGGELARFPLGGLFSKGGRLAAMATWTVDAGSGQDDLAVFITSEGQIAVYQGTDPGDASAWQLIGVYDFAPPIGRRCFLKYGGDLLLITALGVFPLSRALQSKTVNLQSDVSRNIASAFSESAGLYKANQGWQLVYHPSETLLLVNVPTTSFSASTQYVMNTLTGAWASVTGWDSFCFEVHQGQLYMGMAEKVAKAWTGLDDFGNNISAFAVDRNDYLDQRGQSKDWLLVRPILQVLGSISVNAALDVDFKQSSSFGPAIFDEAGDDRWDVARWDTGRWAGEEAPRLNWLTLASPPGYCAAIRLRVTANNATVRWSATDFVFQVGNLL